MSRPTFSGDYQLLTTRPDKRRLSTEDPEYVYVCPNTDITAAYMYAKAYYSDATTNVHSVSLSNLNKGETKCVDIGFAAMSYNSSIPVGETISKIEVYVGTTDTEDDGDKLTYIPYTALSDLKLRVYYSNSYGGLDSLICIGDRQETVESSYQMASVEIAHDAVLQESPQFIIQNSRGRRSFEIHTGHMPEKELEALRELGVKKPLSIYETVNGTATLLPCVLDGNGIALSTARTNLHNQVIRLKYQWEDEAFDRVV